MFTFFSTDDFGYLAATDKNTYAANVRQEVLLSSAGGTPIALSFTFVDMEEGVDVVEVYDGSSRDEQLLATISGRVSSGPTVTSTSRTFQCCW